MVMVFPTLDELPLPPEGKKGWPWTDLGEGGASNIDSRNYPKITVITPSYNQGQYLEETIRSVILQGYPYLEYFVIDGGSHDGSVDIIKKYEKWITWWISEPDKGQSQAINKGFSKSSGEIIAWLNSDDIYLSNTLAYISEAANDNPDIGMFYGSAWFVDENGIKNGKYLGTPLHLGKRKYKFWKGWSVPQPTLFFRRSLLEKAGMLDESLHYALDYDWVIRAVKIAKYRCLERILANYRLHSKSKTADWNKSKFTFFIESEKVTRKYLPPSSPSNWLFWMSWYIYLSRTRIFTTLFGR